MIDNQANSNTPTSVWKNVLVIILTVLLIIVSVLYFIQNKSSNEIVLQLNFEKDSIRTELQQIVLSYDSLKTDNETLNVNLDIAQSKAKDLLIEIEQVKKASISEIYNYREQVNTLRNIMRNYIVQIDSLNRRNEILMEENAQVKSQYSQIQTQNSELAKEKEELSQTVKKAQLLEARSIVVNGLTSRENETDRASKAVKIMVSFVLSKNITSTRGAKNVYLRIMQPNQLLLSKSDKDLFQFEDLNIPYSAVREVNYEGMELPVTIFWDNTGMASLLPGTYKIDIFVDGNIIGSTTYLFKKNLLFNNEKAVD